MVEDPLIQHGRDKRTPGFEGSLVCRGSQHPSGISFHKNVLTFCSAHETWVEKSPNRHRKCECLVIHKSPLRSKATEIKAVAKKRTSRRFCLAAEEPPKNSAGSWAPRKQLKAGDFSPFLQDSSQTLLSGGQEWWEPPSAILTCILLSLALLITRQLTVNKKASDPKQSLQY